MSQVWKRSQHKGSSLLLLLALADFANDEGGSIFPAQSTMAEKVRMTDRAVRGVLQVLLLSGELEVAGKVDRGIVSYQINLDALGRKTFPRNEASDNPSLSLLEDQSIKNNIITDRRNAGSDRKYSAEFERFWKAYPNRTGSKSEAAKWFIRNKPTPDFIDMLIADAAERYKEFRGERLNLVPHAATYLNQRRWEGELPKGAWDGVPLVQSAPARLTMAPEVAKSNADYLKSAAQRVIAAKDRELGRTERIAAQ